MDSNHRRRKPADLQSAPVGHLGNLPFGRTHTVYCPRPKVQRQKSSKNQNSKLQRSAKPQFPITTGSPRRFSRFWGARCQDPATAAEGALVLEVWNLEFHWSLEVGASSFPRRRLKFPLPVEFPFPSLS